MALLHSASPCAIHLRYWTIETTLFTTLNVPPLFSWWFENIWSSFGISVSALTFPLFEVVPGWDGSEITLNNPSLFACLLLYTARHDSRHIDRLANSFLIPTIPVAWWEKGGKLTYPNGTSPYTWSINLHTIYILYKSTTSSCHTQCVTGRYKHLWKFTKNF